MLYSLKVCMKVCVQGWNWLNKYKSLPTKVASVHRETDVSINYKRIYE